MGCLVPSRLGEFRWDPLHLSTPVPESPVTQQTAFSYAGNRRRVDRLQ
jgi:hypothetical protein